MKESVTGVSICTLTAGKELSGMTVAPCTNAAKGVSLSQCRSFFVDNLSSALQHN